MNSSILPELTATAFPHPLNIWQRALRIAWFTISKRWLEIVVPVGVFVMLYLAWSGNWYATPIGAGFKDWEWLKDPVDVTTLVIASVVLLTGLGARWRESLARTVTVCFVRPHTPFENPKRPLSGLACQVPLMADADIRAWAQQVGSQIFGGPLKFLPMLEHAEAMVVCSGKGTELWKGVFIFLTEEPCGEQLETRVWERREMENGLQHRKEEAGLIAERSEHGWGPFKRERWFLKSPAKNGS